MAATHLRSMSIPRSVGPQQAQLFALTPPQITFLDDPNPEKNDQLTRTTNLLVSAVKFYRTLRDKQLEPGMAVGVSDAH